MADRNPLNRLPAEAKARLRKKSQPEWIAPMLATLTDERFSRQGWLFEPKWDGERCLAFRRDRELKLFSRNRILLNEKYPEIMMAFHQQNTGFFIADGEIVTFKDGITSFARLQERMQVGHPRRICSAGFRYGSIFSICFIWTATTRVKFRSGTEKNSFEILSISRARCSSRTIAKPRAKRTIDRRAARDGRG